MKDTTFCSTLTWLGLETVIEYSTLNPCGASCNLNPIQRKEERDMKKLCLVAIIFLALTFCLVPMSAFGQMKVGDIIQLCWLLDDTHEIHLAVEMKDENIFALHGWRDQPWFPVFGTATIFNDHVALEFAEVNVGFKGLQWRFYLPLPSLEGGSASRSYIDGSGLYYYSSIELISCD